MHIARVCVCVCVCCVRCYRISIKNERALARRGQPLQVRFANYFARKMSRNRRQSKAIGTLLCCTRTRTKIEFFEMISGEAAGKKSLLTAAAVVGRSSGSQVVSM